MTQRSQPTKSAHCLYEEVAQKIQADIIRSNLGSGEKLGTELEMAAHYGVSRATIRHALVALENTGLIDRFHGRGTFVADKKARIAGGNGNIQIIVPYLTTSFTGRIVTGAQEVFFHHGHSVSVLSTNNSQEKEGEYIKKIIDQGCPGVIIHATASNFYNPWIFELQRQKIPLVMTRHYQYMESHYVEANNYQGGYDATSHLIKLGHRNIGLVTKHPGFMASLHDRIQGYRAAMSDHGLAIKLDMILADLEDHRYVYMEDRSKEHEQKVITELVEFLQKSPQMTAVICLNDLAAADLLRAARVAGRTVGEDLSIMGFDNIGISANLEPAVTTVNCPTYEIGKAAALILLGELAGTNGGTVGKALPMELVLRESCGPPRKTERVLGLREVVNGSDGSLV
ncbi:MAG TPA: GntR family transcriptional regulator [Limnochordia bacterium]|nr:GntR family transcriptional regulator [Limnochordia bacterium]